MALNCLGIVRDTEPGHIASQVAQYTTGSSTVLTWLIHVVADMRSVWCGAQPGQIASQVGSVRRVLFDLNYTVVEQLEALDDELFVLCAAPLPSQLLWIKVYWVVPSSPCALPLCLPAVVEQLVALDAEVFVLCAACIPHSCRLPSRHLALLSSLSCALLLVPLPPSPSVKEGSNCAHTKAASREEEVGIGQRVMRCVASSEDLRAACPFTAVQKCCVRATRQVQADSEVTLQGAGEQSDQPLLESSPYCVRQIKS